MVNDVSKLEESEKYINITSALNNAVLTIDGMLVGLLLNSDAAKAKETFRIALGNKFLQSIVIPDEDDSEIYLKKLPQRVSSQIRELLSYEEDTAGGIMNSAVITVNPDMTVEQALSFLRIKAEKDNIELYYIYVVDKQNHLVGVVSLRKLLTSPASKKIEDIMISDIVKLP